MSGSFRFDEFEVDANGRELRRGDTLLELQPKVFDMLVYLVANAARVVPKSELFDEVWRGTLVTDNVLAQAVSTLRKTLGDSSRSPRFIRAVPRIGYRFIADVRSTGAAEADARHRLAVLPFTATDPGTPDSALETGIAESLVSRLSNLTNLVVRPLASCLQVVAQHPDPISAGRALDVDSVVAGQIGQRDGRVRVSFELMSVASNEVLRSRAFDETLADIFDVQDAICEDLITRLTPRMRITVPQSGHTSEQAYRAFLEGRLFLGRLTQHDVERAVPLFEQALDEDPGYAPAWASLAECHDFFGTTGSEPVRHYGEARRASKRALSLDAGLPEAHCMQAKIAWLFDWDWQCANSIFSRTAHDFPNRADVLIAYSDFCCYMSDREKSIDLARRALDIDPVSPWVNTLLAQALHMAGNDDDAIRQAERAVDLAPGFPFAHFFLGLSCFCAGEHARGIRELEAAVASGRPDFPSALGLMLALTGDSDGATEILNTIIDAGAAAPPIARALIYVGLGDTELAMRELRACIEQRAWHVLLLRAEPVIANVVSGTMVAKLLDDLELPDPV